MGSKLQAFVVSLFLWCLLSVENNKPNHSFYIWRYYCNLILNLLRAFSLSFIKVKGKSHLLEQSLFSIGTWDFPSLHDDLVGWIETLIIFCFDLFTGTLPQEEDYFLKFLVTNQTIGKNLSLFPSAIYLTFYLYFSLAFLLGSQISFSERSHEKEFLKMPILNLNLDNESIFKEEIEISNQIAAQLHFESAYSYQWQKETSSRFNPYTQKRSINPTKEYWQVFEAKWDSGGACTAVHQPTHLNLAFL